ncbi:MAG: glutamine--fructose-6-phosphate transaminase (isomerizing) [Buchnera aphidicola (Brevicoryne brassicae)]|uniref:Glutamine--fructose-6-phosphate aminotransferase [isomerizing] n=1 Tax=Buchnera aphidicola (Brevicoryne brassicae) TaxID=911343 RepID=A0AAJ5PUL7_9GAMM|nr:glutamine--fructose-6-phosphate transaminase (isomerizing) [Buchnera aphidicola]QCI19615.1 glutamine--fructose-6-phosphate transaminase (isomerizing) [Buchnera aphidicola (Brevicoryne brassicae)]WAI18986.1 MAG: glutamine--fructose-6-phosphate transaminase (isomerizing) [Buchnera aphidicola (Brevicoryne brassicae)]
MCGIVGAVTQRNIINFLIKGIKKLEYRGYDSSGLAIVNHENNIIRIRCVGKVNKLITKVNKKKIFGNIGIAHTRWATHGRVSKENTHPHISSNIIVVHNGIIENNSILRNFLKTRGYIFYSDTDTEVIAHLLHWEQNKTKNSIKNVIQKTMKKLHGNYSMVIIDKNNPLELIAVRSRSPLVIGLGSEENFIASDQIALLHITKRFIYLEEGDIAIIKKKEIDIFNKYNCIINRQEIVSNIKYETVNKGKYRHYMEKEIYEQPRSIEKTLQNRLKKNNTINFLELGKKEDILFCKIEHIQIVACGTSYNAAMVSRYWFESLTNIPCDVEIASEFFSRKLAVRKNSFLITLSQSGETADTLSALRYSKKLKYLGNLTICNMEGSSLVKESDYYLSTKAGIEIGVASTKSFTTQLTVLLMLVAKLANLQKKRNIEKKIVQSLNVLPTRIQEILKKNPLIKNMANQLSNKKNILFIGRGEYYPIAMEGALKLKEISYIHAEAYPAGELKHGPLALIDKNIPVIIIAPKNSLLEKIKKNIKEISLRGGLIYVFSDQEFDYEKNVNCIKLPYIEELIAPIFYTIPLQLLAYYIALSKKKNIDQPRHLAKSVTVE